MLNMLNGYIKYDISCATVKSALGRRATTVYLNGSCFCVSFR